MIAIAVEFADTNWSSPEVENLINKTNVFKIRAQYRIRNAAALSEEPTNPNGVNYIQRT